MIKLDITVAPGHYVLAVSGGVDSMVLLNLLKQQPGVKLTIAHYDHGIRDDSADDRRLVQAAARFYGVPVVYHEGNLGVGASEASARQARYDFLQAVRKASNARAIITAHHQDDVLETAILNMLRGTSRRGLSSLQSKTDIVRPMLHIPKADIVAYAQARDLIWREDSTNSDETYLRNYVRQRIIPRIDPDSRGKFMDIINRSQAINQELDAELINQLHFQPKTKTLDKRWFAGLPHSVAREVMAMWLREHGLRNFDRRTLERLTVHAKTLAAGQNINVFQHHWLRINGDHLALSRDEV